MNSQVDSLTSKKFWIDGVVLIVVSLLASAATQA